MTEAQSVAEFEAMPLGRSWTPAREQVALFCILAAALRIRLPGLSESLWFDEVMYTPSGLSQPGMLSFMLWKDVHPPLFTLVLIGWAALFGEGEITVRLPSLLSGLASLGLFWLMARRWLGPGPGLVATALLALSPPHIWYSHEVKVNMLLLVLSVASAWFYWQAVETGSRRYWIYASITLIASIYTHGYGVPVGLALFLWLAWRAWDEAALRRPVFVSALVVALVVAPLALLKYSQIPDLQRGYLRQLSPANLYTLLLVWLPSGNTLRTISPYSPFSQLAAQPWPYFLLDGYFALLLIRGLVSAFRAACGNGRTAPSGRASAKQSARLILLWFIIPVLFTLAGSLADEHFYIERNLLVVLPPFLLLLVMGMDFETAGFARSFTVVTTLVLAIAASASLLFIKTQVWTVYKFKPDWRGAAGYLNDEVKANGAVRLLLTNPTNELDYYGPRVVLRGLTPGPEKRLRTVGACFGNAADAVVRRAWSTFYLLKNTTWDDCWDKAWQEVAHDPRFRLVEQTRFKGLAVYKFIRPSPERDSDGSGGTH